MEIKPKYQVFISSTYEDMRDERQAAMEAILRKNHIPAGMEVFSARHLDQFEVIKNWIEMCDVFLLILGGRYGSICRQTRKSFVEMEFDYAQKLGKPMIAVNIDKDYLVVKKAKAYANNNLIYDGDNSELYSKLVEKVKKCMCNKYSNLDELKLQIVGALDAIESDSNCIIGGWVHSDYQIRHETGTIILNEEILRHLLKRFIYSLSFQYTKRIIKTGRGHYDSDKFELSTGQYDYYHYEEAQIWYEKLQPIDDLVIKSQTLNYEGGMKGHPDILRETVEFCYEKFDEPFYIDIIHHVKYTEDLDNRTLDTCNFSDTFSSRVYEAERMSIKLMYQDFTVTCKANGEKVILRQGYSKENPYLWELINTDDSSKFVLFIVMGGSGVQIKEVLPGDTWREGNGEEYLNYFNSYKEAAEWRDTYIKEQK